MSSASDQENDIVVRLRKRAAIRRQISERKSAQEGKPDRLADLLEEAANEIESRRPKLPPRLDNSHYDYRLYNAKSDCDHYVTYASGGGVRCLKCPGWFCY